MGKSYSANLPHTCLKHSDCLRQNFKPIRMFKTGKALIYVVNRSTHLQVMSKDLSYCLYPMVNLSELCQESQYYGPKVCGSFFKASLHFDGMEDKQL